MKKLLSILLAFMMLFSCFPVAFATNETADEGLKIECTYEEDDFEEEEDFEDDWGDDCPEESFVYGSISLGETLTLNVAQNETYSFQVTASENGVYVFSFSDAEYNVQIDLYDTDENHLAESWYEDKLTYELEAGKTYHFNVQFYDDWEEGTFNVSFNKGLHCDFKERHSFSNYKYNNDATEYLDGTKTVHCDYGCGESRTVTAIGTALNPNIIDLELNERKTVTLKPDTGVIFRINSKHSWWDGDEYWYEHIFDSTVNSKIIANFYYDENYGQLDGGMGVLPSWGNYGAPVANEVGHIYYLSLFNTHTEDITYSVKLLLESEHQHNFVHKEDILPKSCTRNGWEVLVCECGAEKRGNIIPATGQCVYNVSYVQEPTCVDYGFTYYECECGNGYEGDIIPETGIHNLQRRAKNDATCYADGTISVWCENCGNCDDKITDTGTMLSHRFNEYTPNDDGTKTAYCIFDCGVTDTVSDNGVTYDFEYYISDSKATVTKYIGSDSEVVIPETIEGYPVVEIKKAICSGTEDISKITIPDSVSFIESEAFSHCYGLSEIVVDHNNKNYTSDDYGVLYTKDKTVLMQYPTGSNNETYVVPNTVKTIDKRAFANCPGIINVTISDSVEAINDLAFSYCTNLTNVKLGNSVEYIGKNAFEWCESLNDVTFPENLKEIGDDAFQFCHSFKNIIIPDSVTRVGQFAFEGWEEKERVVIGKGLKVIEWGTFSSYIVEVVVPATVEKIEASAFGNYPFIKHLCYEGTQAQWDDIELYNNLVDEDEYFHLEYVPEIIDIKTEPTCTSVGYEGTSCSCGYDEKGELLISKDHAYENYYSDNNATCTEDGTKTAECVYGCGKNHTVTDEGSAKGHELNDWVNDETEGTATRSCNRCDYTETAPLTNQGDGDVGIIAPEVPDLDFNIDEIVGSDNEYLLLEETVKDNLGLDWELLKAFDITLKNKDGVHVQPDGTVKVKLPLDWEKDGNYKVYRVNDDGTLTDMNAYRQGSHMVFETDHFSVYVIVDETLTADDGIEDEENSNRFDFIDEFIGLLRNLIDLLVSLISTVIK